MERMYNTQAFRVVAIGGGSGLSRLLRGLRRYTDAITAIVAMTDDGGSSGKLKRELGSLALGDLRNCLAALADADPTMLSLLQYRFRNGGCSLEGHSLGNLLLAALFDISGDPKAALRESHRLLIVRGRVLPMTFDAVNLGAEMADGSWVLGETAIVAHPAGIRRVYLEPPHPAPPSEAIEAILQAEVVIIGPGSLFTSVIPNLLVEEIAEAITMTGATRVYVCNLATQPGETDGFSASDHVRTIESHVGRRIFDYVVVNSQVHEPKLVEDLRQSGQCFVEPDVDRILQMGYRVITGDFIDSGEPSCHDPDRLIRAILKRVGKEWRFFTNVLRTQTEKSMVFLIRR
jgi:uncharacterized cofD-like protein